MRHLVILSAALVAATSLGVNRFRSDGLDHATAVEPAPSFVPAAGAMVHVTDLRFVRIRQANRPGCCEWVPMEEHDGTRLQVRVEPPVLSIAVIELVGALRVGAPDRFQEELFAAIEVDGVVDEGGQVVARVSGVDPVFSSIETWEQVATRMVALLAPGEHTIRAVWRDSHGTTAAQANNMSLLVTVYAASTSCPGDGNGDGVVDFDDLLQVLDGWGGCPG